MYREMIVDRFKNPHYRGELDPHDYSYEDDNPTCGDHIRIDIRVDENEMVTEAAFSGEGCSISQASADMLIEAILNKPLDEVKAITKEQVLENLGIELGPVRLKCALLSLKVLKGSVYGLPEGGVSDELLGA